MGQALIFLSSESMHRPVGRYCDATARIDNSRDRDAQLPCEFRRAPRHPDRPWLAGGCGALRFTSPEIVVVRVAIGVRYHSRRLPKVPELRVERPLECRPRGTACDIGRETLVARHDIRVVQDAQHRRHHEIAGSKSVAVEIGLAHRAPSTMIRAGDARTLPR